ncbi:hyaluronidase-1-like isoform X2 [Branchiostoma lanceolatum]|uniref:hyaluronidase-1-like isoform X2 n=1 Tax=Branchiostoma lanceolatum TaxID=7740 RepID=UPI0034546242
MTLSSRANVFVLLLLGQAYVSQEGPALPDRPFNIVWNVPSRVCTKKFGIEINLDGYEIVYNPGHEWNGTYMTIFYANDLGLYPNIHEQTGEENNGGLPQKADLKDHLTKATDDISRLIPDADYRGLGVIDWEFWRPLWRRNWGSKNIYRTKSEELVRQELPYASRAEVTTKAKEEFEGAARKWMGETLNMVKTVRPGGFWGFYLFPDCYNFPHLMRLQEDPSYDCRKKVKSDNDELQWLWEESTALYPSIYLSNVFKRLPSSEQFVRARVAETFRVMNSRQSSDIPVYPYVRLRYRESVEYLTETDLASSIQEPAGQGSAGVVIWGAWADVNTKENCLILRDYVTTTFGPFAKKMVQLAAECSMRECNNHGRCVTTYERTSTDPSLEQRQVEEGASSVYPLGQNLMSEEDASSLRERLQYLPGRQGTSCRCYPGWTGEICSIGTHEEL